MTVGSHLQRVHCPKANYDSPKLTLKASILQHSFLSTIFYLIYRVEKLGLDNFLGVEACVFDCYSLVALHGSR